MYKIGSEYSVNFTNPEEAKGYKLGGYVTIFEGIKPLAKYVVEELNDNGLSGKILVTYGHKRTKK